MNPLVLRPGALTAGALVACFLAGCQNASVVQAQAITNPATPHKATGGRLEPYALPRMGSGGYAYAYGSAWPGASVPNGMMRVGPDTSGYYGNLSALHFSGYWAGDTTILEFSHLHLHGTGAQDYGVLGVLPIASLDSSKLTANSYQPTFNSANETADPGYYSVKMDNGIRAELTATAHASLERFTFPTSSGTVLLDLTSHLSANSVKTASLAIDPGQQSISGQLQTMGGMSGGFTLYFVARFNQPWAAQHVWTNSSGPVGSGNSASGTGPGAAFDFDVTSGNPVELQVAVSLVSAAGASGNLASEMTTWNFDTVENAAIAAWNARLNAITIYATPDQADEVSTFYSALHHAFVMPGRYSDDDGSFVYYGQTGTASGFHFLTDISGWDIYRTLAPLYALVAPDVSLDLVQSLYAMAQITTNFPKWPLATDDAGTMIGAAADVIISDAYVKGITGFDATNVYKRLRDAALDTTMPPGEGRGGRSDATTDYMTYGYVLPGDGAVVSLTCEYNQDDYALSNFANAMGATQDANALLARSTGYRKLFDPSTGFLRAHNPDGTIPNDGFNPDDFGLAAEYDEADAYQSMFCPQHDVTGLAALWGGPAKFAAELNSFFESSQQEWNADLAAAAAAPPTEDPDEYARNLPTKYYFGGNEPDIHYLWLFAQVGRPDLTDSWSVWARNAFYSSQTNGLPGNDDGGTMSAWYVFSMLGIYPIPGSDQYVIGSPAFARADLQVNGGKFTITAQNVSSTNIYVQSATLNGQALDAAVIHHSDLKPGGSLVLVMGSKPSGWAQSN